MSERQHITPVGDTGMYILDTASWRVFRPVMDKEQCVECGMCLTYCPVNAIVKIIRTKLPMTTARDAASAPRNARAGRLRWYRKEAARR
jgi:Pyruvate/2-oxoacid:ferredoxin oxidoreductase delta subunit